MDIKSKLLIIKHRFHTRKAMESGKNVYDLFDKIKSFNPSKSGGLRKLFIGVALVSGLSFGTRAETNASKSNNAPDNVKNNISYAQKHFEKQIELKETKRTVDYISLAELQNVKKSGYYNGVFIEFDKIKPEVVPHIFESGNNPTILNYGSTSIKDAKYLGDYQFDLNSTIYEFVKSCRKDFPELAKIAGVDPQSGKIEAKNARTEAFYKAYCDLCNGDRAEEFSQKRFAFMYKTHFKPVFEKLATEIPGFPKITPENYHTRENFLLAALVASTATQAPGAAFGIIKKAVENAKLTAAKQNKENVKAIDIYAAASDIKTKRWGHKGRYEGEKKLSADLAVFFAAQNEIDTRKQTMTKELMPSRQIGFALVDNVAVKNIQLDNGINVKLKTAKDKNALRKAQKTPKKINFLAMVKERLKYRS